MERHPAARLAGMGKSIPSCQGEINWVFQPPPQLQMVGVSSRGRKQGCFQPGPPAGAGPGWRSRLRDHAADPVVQQRHGSEVHRLGNRAGESCWGIVLGRRARDDEVKRTAGGLGRETQRDSPLLQWPWHGGAVDQGGQVRPELDPAFLPQVRGQPGETMAVRPDLQPGQLYEKAGVGGGYEALDSDQSSDQADQDGWATGTPRKEAGVSACRGAGNQGNADRDTRTDQPASAGAWLACFESTGISESYGVVPGK